MHNGIIYIIVGEFNVTPGAVADRGGLVCNVGYTDRGIKTRLKDSDYKKSPGGKWKTLHTMDARGIHDKEIHKHLRKHSGVKHTATRNTEEFIFVGDPGDGSVAPRVVKSIVDKCSKTLDVTTPYRFKGTNCNCPAWDPKLVPRLDHPDGSFTFLLVDLKMKVR